ncbi:MAG: hypothetical protein H5T62_07405 [Anaerolineae bacterium]|nr:hypothetical protein [Anaerolineae bacterium]
MNRDRATQVGAILLVIAFCTVITVIVTYPVTFRLASAVAGFEGYDALQYVWSLWWAKTALVDLHTSLANVAMLYMPSGAYHPLLIVTPYLELSAVPLTLACGPVVTYNLLLLLSFILTGLTTYLLAYELSGDRLAAFLGGLVFAFFPNRLGHALGGHLPQLTAYWFPLYALSLVRLVRRPTYWQGLWCGVCLALSLLVNLQHIAYLVAPFTLVFLLWHWRSWRDVRFLGGLALALAVAALLTAPFFVPFLMDKLQGGLSFLKAGGTVRNSIDLLAYLSPSPTHPLLSRLGLLPDYVNRLFAQPRDVEEGLAYLGLLPLLLAGWGIVRGRSDRWMWAALGGTSLVLALGPLLKVGGTLASYTVEGQVTYIPLPYALIKMLPLYEWGRTPGRLSETAAFALAILVGYGAADLRSRLRGRWSPVVLIAGAALFILVEYAVVFPFPMGDATVPDFYSQMAADGKDYAVLDLPIMGRPASNYAMYYQTIHRHRIVGGYIHRYPPGTRELTDFISNLAQPSPNRDIVSHPSAQERRAWLAQAGIGRVIVHKDLMIAVQREAVIAFLRDLLGEPVFEDEQIVAFAVPPLDEPGEGRLFSFSSQGWHQPEQWGEFPARWLSEGGALYVWQSTGETARLRFMTYAFQQPQVVEVVVNDQPVGAVLAHADWPEYVTSDFVLQPGLNVIRFTLPGGCTDFIGDPRCLVRQRFAARFAQELECDESQRTPRCLGALIGGVELVSGESVFPERRLDANIGDRVRLLGGDWPADPVMAGESLPVTLYWQGLTPMREDYTVFVHLTDAAGQVVAQHDGYPLGGSYPTSDWPVGVTVTDRVEIPLPPDLPPGEYTLKTGMYLLSTLERLPVAGDVTGENAVVLGTVTVK